KLAVGLVILVVAFFTIQAAKRKSFLAQVNMPIVKGGLPYVGNVSSLINGSPWDVMTAWAMNYGGGYIFHMFGSDAIVISDPEMLKIVLNKKMSVFGKDLAWTYKPFLVILGNGIVTAHGQSWRRQRNLLTKVLRIDILDVVPGVALGAAKRFTLKLNEAVKSGNKMEMSEEFRHLTLQVIADIVLSLSPEESDNTFAHMYLPIVEEGNKRTWDPTRMFLPTPAWFNFRAAVARLDGYVKGLIRTRYSLRQKEATSGKPVTRTQDILDIVMGAVTEEDWGEAAITQIADEMKTFILAGHETSASMLAWSLYELTQNRELFNRVREEAISVFGPNVKDIDSIVMPDRDGLAKLVFSECCLREGLRKYSVVPSVVRVSNEDVQLDDDHFLPTGSTVMVNIQGVHHNPKYWPDPMTYDPTRFLKPVTPYTFIPFVEGPRMCLGQYLSLLESKVVLSLLVYFYDFETLNADANEKHPFMVPIIPKTGHYMKISKA
ncbi:unnamed protein product, partial [Ectocarpus fasciculatus]